MVRVNRTSGPRVAARATGSDIRASCADILAVFTGRRDVESAAKRANMLGVY